MDNNTSINNDQTRSLLFFIAMTFSTLFMFRGLTLWGPYSELESYFEYFAWFFTTVLLVTSFQAYSPLAKLIIVCAIPLSLYIGLNCDRLSFTYFSLALIVGAKDVEFKKIVKVHFGISLSFCLFNVIGNYLGYIKDATNLDQSDRLSLFFDSVLRKSFGYDWSTDFASHVFLILLSLWVIKKGLLSYKLMALYLAIMLFVLFETGTRMASAVIFLIVLFSLYCKFRNPQIISKIVKYLTVFSVPFFACISLYLTMKFNDKEITWLVIDAFMSGRLQFGQDAILEKGIPLFGQVYKMYGGGNSLGGNEYNYIDNSYIQFLVILGIVATLAFIFCYVRLCLRAYKQNDVVLLLAVFASALFGVITQFQFNYAFCPLVLGAFAALNGDDVFDDSVEDAS